MTRDRVMLEARALLNGLLCKYAETPEGDDVIKEWGEYFWRMNLMLPDEQCDEINGIMRARVQSGCMSVRAPNPEKELR